jgi:hypothetical protein
VPSLGELKKVLDKSVRPEELEFREPRSDAHRTVVRVTHVLTTRVGPLSPNYIHGVRPEL